MSTHTQTPLRGYENDESEKWCVECLVARDRSPPLSHSTSRGGERKIRTMFVQRVDCADRILS